MKVLESPLYMPIDKKEKMVRVTEIFQTHTITRVCSFTEFKNTVYEK